MNGWETEGPYEWDGLGRDVCYAWTKRGSRCGMPGTAWPHGVLGSDVYLCGIHGRRMEETVRHSVQEGHLKLRLPEPVAPLEHKEHTLYKYYDAQGEPLYFGISHNFKTRNRVHSEKAWYADVDRCDLELFTTRSDALLAERVAIQAELPRHNITHRASAPSTSADEPTDAPAEPYAEARAGD